MRSVNAFLMCSVASVLAAGCGRAKKSTSDDSPVPGQLLTVSSFTATTVSLSWAAATDDKTAPAALDYQVLYSLSNDMNSVESTITNGTAAAPFAPGITDAVVTGLAPDTTYYFAVLVVDAADNAAVYSAVPAVTTPPCSAALPTGGCPAASVDKLTLCGRLVDAETDAFFEAAGATGAACAGPATSEGPCSVTIRFYDMVDFAGNPAGATPIAPASLVVDDCGRFRATDLEPPSLGFAAVTVDDAMGTTDRHRLTTIAALEGAPDPETNRSLRAYVTRSATDVAWSTGAGLVGPTFADRGVIVANFRYQGAGHAGVTIIRNGMASAPDDHYFSDVDASRTTIDPGASATGTNGTALFLGSSLVEHSGQGGQPVGCQWPSSLAAATAGVVFFVPMDAETNTGLPCP